MYLSEEASKHFAGTGERNASGDDLMTFLEKYNPNKYQNPSNTVDTIVFSYEIREEKPVVSGLLLIKRGNHPSIGWWALPGGFVEYREDIGAAAMRELQEETGVEDIELEQLKAYGAYDRDPRTRIITTAYVALVKEGSVHAEAADDAKDSDWFDISDECESTFSDESGIVHEIHILTLTGREKKAVTCSKIEVTYNTAKILKNRQYKVLETEGLAADHGAVILEGYHYVNKEMG